MLIQNENNVLWLFHVVDYLIEMESLMQELQK